MMQGTKMVYEVDDAIRKKTTMCVRDFSCLSGDKECLCEVKDCIQGKVHFIRPISLASDCNYRMSFGHTYVCNCPMRKEIFNRYNA